MRICRRVLVTGLWLTVAAAASAQSTRPPNPFGEPDRRTTNHLSLDAQVSRTSVAPGGSLTLRVDVTPRPAMHVYAPGEHDYQVIQLAVAPQPWLRAGPTEYPASETYYFEPLDEKVPVYSKPFRLTRQITILDTPEARKALAGRSSVELAGTLQYQACDDTVCYAPGKVPVSFTITLTRPGAREVAADGGRARPLRPPIPAVRGRRPLSHSTPPQARPH